MTAPLILPGRSFRRSDRVSRNLFHFRAADGSLNALTGQLGTLTRATPGGVIADARGKARRPVHSQPRWEMVDLDGDGIRETPGLLLETGRTNKALRFEEADNASWTKTNITVTPNAWLAPDGTLSADRLVETATATVQHRLEQLFTITAGATITLSAWVKAGERDRCTLFGVNTGDRCGMSFDLTTRTVGDYNLGAGANTDKGYEVWQDTVTGDVWFRIWVTGTVNGVSTAITGELLVQDSGGFGTSYTGDVTKGLYVWGLDFKQAGYLTSAIPTLGATVATNDDRMTWQFDAYPQAMTIYIRMVDRGTAFLAGGTRVFMLGLATAPRLGFHCTGNVYRFFHDNAVANAVSDTPSLLPNRNDLVELCAQLYPDGSVQAYRRFTTPGGSAGAVGSGARSAANALASDWQNHTLELNGQNGTLVGGGVFLEAKVAGGVLSLDQMAEQF